MTSSRYACFFYVFARSAVYGGGLKDCCLLVASVLHGFENIVYNHRFIAEICITTAIIVSTHAIWLTSAQWQSFIQSNTALKVHNLQGNPLIFRNRIVFGTFQKTFFCINISIDFSKCSDFQNSPEMDELERDLNAVKISPSNSKNSRS